MKDTTFSNFHRKISRTINAEARNLVSRFPGKNIVYLQTKMNTDELIERFGRVRDFDNVVDKKSWTFWTYARRAEDIFGDRARIFEQISGYKSVIRTLAGRALEKHLARAGRT